MNPDENVLRVLECLVKNNNTGNTNPALKNFVTEQFRKLNLESTLLNNSDENHEQILPHGRITQEEEVQKKTELQTESVSSVTSNSTVSSATTNTTVSSATTNTTVSSVTSNSTVSSATTNTIVSSATTNTTDQDSCTSPPSPQLSVTKLVKPSDIIMQLSEPLTQKAHKTPRTSKVCKKTKLQRCLKQPTAKNSAAMASQPAGQVNSYVSQAALEYKASERIQRLAEPRTRVQKFMERVQDNEQSKTDKNLKKKIVSLTKAKPSQSGAAIVYKTSERIRRLAEPRIRAQKFVDLVKAEAQTRTNKVLNTSVQSPMKAKTSASQVVLTYKTSERIQQLAEPRNRKQKFVDIIQSMEPMWIGNIPYIKVPSPLEAKFNVSRAALEYKPSERILQLAAPRNRNLSIVKKSKSAKKKSVKRLKKKPVSKPKSVEPKTAEPVIQAIQPKRRVSFALPPESSSDESSREPQNTEDKYDVNINLSNMFSEWTPRKSIETRYEVKNDNGDVKTGSSKGSPVKSSKAQSTRVKKNVKNLRQAVKVGAFSKSKIQLPKEKKPYVSQAALSCRPTKRIKTLAKPKTRREPEVENTNLCSGVTKGSLNYVASERILKLATPRTKISLL